MSIRTGAKLAAAVAVAAVSFSSAASAAPTVAITSPVDGAVVSRADETMLVTGTSTFGAPVAAERTFFLRGSGCGATEAFWLSTKEGEDEYDGCGSIGGVPFNEAFYQLLGSEPNSFTAEDGVPVMLDASKDVAGTIRAESWTGDGTPGAGQVVVDVALYGLDAANRTVALGSASFTAVNTGADGVQVPFTFDVPDTADRVVVRSLTIDVAVRGANYNSSNLGLSGDSKFTLPIYDAGTVLVAGDSAAFAATRTATAIVAEDGTWTAEIPIPAVGSRKVYARAIQSGVRTDATPVTITVVA